MLEKREKYRRSIWVKDYLKFLNSRTVRDLEFHEDVLLKNFMRISKTLLYAFGGLWSQLSQNRILLLQHALLFSTPFNISKASAIATITFVKRVHRTGALNASKGARVWAWQTKG
jgi:hypothetical protein